MAAVSTLPTSDVASSSSAPPPSSAEVTKPIYRRPRQAAVGSKAGEGAQAVLPQTILGLVDTVLEEGERELQVWLRKGQGWVDDLRRAQSSRLSTFSKASTANRPSPRRLLLSLILICLSR